MTRRSILWRAAVLAGAGAPTAVPAQAAPRGPAAAPPAAPATCYRVDLGAWAPRLGLGGDSVFTLPPRRISVAAAADTSPRGLIRGARPVRATLARPGSVHRAGYWRAVRPDSAEVIFTTGFSGVTLYVRPDGPGWRGAAETFWDFPRPAQRAEVTLAPVRCAP